jgi:hypothetical protein
MVEYLENRINGPLKRVLLVLMKLLGEEIGIGGFGDLTEELWEMHKHKVEGLQQRTT